MVDDGADLPLLLNSPFVSKNDLMGKVGKVAKGSISGSDGAEVTTFRGKVRKAVIGGYAFSDFPVRLHPSPSRHTFLEEPRRDLGQPDIEDVQYHIRLPAAEDVLGAEAVLFTRSEMIGRGKNLGGSCRFRWGALP
jgi:hypothetical protein